jgi:hypothetical protein
LRSLAVSLRRLTVSVLRAIDVEGFLILSGLGIIIALTWETPTPHIEPVPLGPLVLAVALIVTGIAFARAPRGA